MNIIIHISVIWIDINQDRMDAVRLVKMILTYNEIANIYILSTSSKDPHLSKPACHTVKFLMMQVWRRPCNWWFTGCDQLPWSRLSWSATLIKNFSATYGRIKGREHDRMPMKTTTLDRPIICCRGDGIRWNLNTRRKKENSAEKKGGVFWGSYVVYVLHYNKLWLNYYFLSWPSIRSPACLRVSTGSFPFYSLIIYFAHTFTDGCELNSKYHQRQSLVYCGMRDRFGPFFNELHIYKKYTRR